MSGSIDPIRDIEVVNTELNLADIASLQKRNERLQKQVRSGDKTAKIEAALIERMLPHLNEGKPATTFSSSPEEASMVRSFFLLTEKRTIFAGSAASAILL